MVHWLCFISFLVVLLCLQTTQADPRDKVEFSVINDAPTTTGGRRFENEIGSGYCKDTMVDAAKFISKTIRLEREQLTGKHIQLNIGNYMDAIWFEGDGIGISTNHIAQFSGDLHKEITGLLYQLMVHPFQGTGNGTAPPVLLEGIAGFVRIKADLEPDYWKKRGEGDLWYRRFDIAALFFEYCDDVTPGGFVASLNERLNQREYSAGNFFDGLLGGKTVDESWSDYKTLYNSTP